MIFTPGPASVRELTELTPLDTAASASDALPVAPQPVWWHDQTIVVISRAVLLNAAAVVGLLVAEQLAAHLIDGHTPMWGVVGNVCYAVGLLATEVAAAVILLRAPTLD
jgi:hypothetical protein